MFRSLHSQFTAVLKLTFILPLLFLTSELQALDICTSWDQLYDSDGCTVKADKQYLNYSYGEVDVKILKSSDYSPRKTSDLFYLVGPYSITKALEGSVNMDAASSPYIPYQIRNAAANNNADLVYFDYSRKPNDPLQNKAFALSAALKMIQSLQGRNEPSVMLGLSLGGVVARYALTDLEASSYDHGVQYYISFDSPHQGAHVPIGLQYTLEFMRAAAKRAADDNSGDFLASFVNVLADIIDFFTFNSADLDGMLEDMTREAYAAVDAIAMIKTDSIDSPAARQLLISHYKQSSGGRHPLGVTLMSELKELGLPKNTKQNIAIVNGALNGSPLELRSNSTYFDYLGGSGDDNWFWLKPYVFGGTSSSVVHYDNNNQWSGRYFEGRFNYEDASNSLFGDGYDQHKADVSRTSRMSDLVPCSTNVLPSQMASILRSVTPSRNPIRDFNETDTQGNFIKTSCWIPTISALAIPEIWEGVSGVDLEGFSPFDRVIANNTNDGHLALNSRSTSKIANTLREVYQLNNNVSLNDNFLIEETSGRDGESITVPAVITEPSPPTIYSSSQTSSSSYTLSWTPSKRVEYYQWRVDDGSWKNAGPNLSSVLPNLDVGYLKLEVRACNYIGCTNSSPFWLTRYGSLDNSSDCPECLLRKTLTCSSNDFSSSTCGFGAEIVGFFGINQLSSSSCAKGNIKINYDTVTVKNGCRAELDITLRFDDAPRFSLTCASRSKRYSKCSTKSGYTITKVWIENKYSKSACSLNSSYGFGSNYIWVNKGCRAKIGYNAVKN